MDALLDDASLRVPEAHTERLTLLTAVLSEALRRHGMVATLVGGGALEFYMPEGYVTHDIDLVVERSGEPIIEESLRDTWDRLHGRKPEREDEHAGGEGS